MFEYRSDRGPSIGPFALISPPIVFFPPPPSSVFSHSLPSVLFCFSSLPMFLHIFFFFIPLFYCAKFVGSKQSSFSSSFSPPSVKFEDLDLLKRPLNAYIVENGKHAKVEEKIIEIGKGNGTTESILNTVKYNISRPPFAIIQRGAVILFNYADNSTFWPNWHHGHPSIVQMVSASGHSVVETELNTETDEIGRTLWEIAKHEKLHNLVIVGIGQKSSDTAKELIGKKDRTDAIILLKGPEDLVKKSELRKDERKQMKIVLIKQKEGAKTATDEEAVNTANAEWHVAEKGERAMAQLMANLLDWVHPR